MMQMVPNRSSMISAHLMGEPKHVDSHLQALIEEFSRESIGAAIKKLVLEEFESSFLAMFQDIEKAKKTAISAYKSLQSFFQRIAEDSALFETLRELYGSVVLSNFTFALDTLRTLLPVLMFSVEAGPDGNLHLEYSDFQRLMKELRRIVDDTSEMPDATAVESDEGQIDSLSLSWWIMTYNLALFPTLVIVVIGLAQMQATLTKKQIQELQVLLRDWTQETIAQLSMLTDQQCAGSTLRVEGIVPSPEDIEIAEDFGRIDSDLE